MSGYDLLKGVRVLEVAALGPSSLGGYLADMGADVVKVETGAGDGLRYQGSPAMGSPQGESLLHLRWNRGKRSIVIDLKSDEGRDLFLALADKADVVIEGMRAGVLDRLGLGYDALRKRRPAIVFCSLSGFGSYGPYAEMGSHAPSFDAFAALLATNPYALTKEERAASNANPIGMHAMGLYAATGTLAALIKARATGEGTRLEVAATDCAVNWLPDVIDAELNREQCFERPGFYGAKGRQAGWARLWIYRTRDGRGLFFQAIMPRFWDRFCATVERPDLAGAYQTDREVNTVDDEVHAKLEALFATRDFADWMALCEAADVPAGPAHSLPTLIEDPHFLARDSFYLVDMAQGGTLRLTGTPVKVDGQAFAPNLAPRAGADETAIRADWLG
ncbi:MAG: CoA transferase [Sphingomonadales bacterium]|nr:CoA transferase [Sphingomonadales bacterium]